VRAFARAYKQSWLFDRHHAPGSVSAVSSVRGS